MPVLKTKTALTIVLGVIAVVILFLVLRNPEFRRQLQQLFSGMAAPAAPTTTTPPPVEGAGEFPYAPTGAANELDDQGQGTRHYASGKADDTTHEWESSTNAQSYMIVIDITLTETDHDDTISFKYGGTHNGSGWYDMGYSFESGQACAGKEEDHPSADQCEVTGTEIGNLVNNRKMLCAVNIGKGEKLELWSKSEGGAWQKDVETGPGVTGFRPSEDEDEIQVRIDAAPGIEMHSANWYEIQGTGTSVSGGEITNEPEGASSGEEADQEEDEEAEESGGDDEEEEDEEGANIARVLTAMVAKKKLRNDMFKKSSRRYKEDGDFIPYNVKLRDMRYQRLGGYR